jgi:hypothetical protein
MSCGSCTLDACSCTRCVANNVHILLLPAHTTHILQVADISVFGPFKKYLATAFVAHRCTENTQINNSMMARLTHLPLVRATSETNVRHGFEKAGIHPFNPNKMTAAVYKNGLQHRGLEDDTSKTFPPPAPPLPYLPPASSTATSHNDLAQQSRVETVAEVLSFPPARARSDPTIGRKRKLDTTYAVMVTEKEHVDALRAYREQKQKEESETVERKQKRAVRHEEILQEKVEKQERKRERQKKKSPRLKGKENTPPTNQQDEDDPYAHKTKYGSTGHSTKTAIGTTSTNPSHTPKNIL